MALMTQLSRLPWLPTPSVTQAPPMMIEQYREPEWTSHFEPAGVGGAGERTGGGGDGDGGGGDIVGGSGGKIASDPVMI